MLIPHHIVTCIQNNRYYFTLIIVKLNLFRNGSEIHSIYVGSFSTRRRTSAYIIMYIMYTIVYKYMLT